LLTDAGGAGAAPEGEVVRITSAGFTVATGSFAVSPNWTAASASGDIGLFTYNLHPNEILDAANDIQRTLYLPRYTILTPITDGDMEASNTTSWVDVGTCTQTKTTTASEVLTGIQALKLVIPAGVTNGVTSTNLAVQDGETILVSVAFKTSGANISVQLYDVTNSAAIKTITPANAIFTTWVECRFLDAVPSGCRNVAVRLLNASASTETTAYVDWVAAYRTQHQTLDLPSQVLDAVDPVLKCLPLGLSTDDNQIYNAELEFSSWPSEPLRDFRALTSHRITVGTPIEYPLFLSYRTTGSTMSTLASTTEAPVELILHGALSICLGKLADRAQNTAMKADYARRAFNASRVYHELLDALELARPQVPQRGGIRRVDVPWD